MARHPLLSVGSIIASMSLNAVGSGIIFTYVPYILTHNAFPAWVAGSMVTAIAGGGIAGCLIAGPLIRRVGHARAFACFMAIVILSVWIIALGVQPAAWIGSRVLYGVASNGIFIVAQSWLNEAAENHWRGRAMSFFYMAYVLSLGIGAFAFGFMPSDGNLPALMAISFAALAVLPISLTRLKTPPPPEWVEINLRAAWRISPVGMVGILTAGGLTMLVQGFTPIYVTRNGFGQQDVALLTFLMQFGMLGVQYPLGMLSDRIDRRRVLIGTCLLIAGMAAIAAMIGFGQFALVALIFAIWAGATETIYSVANAHANDRAEPGTFVALASTMLVAWSTAAFVAPLVVTTLTPVFGPKTFMYAVVVLALCYAVFVAIRLTMREAIPPEETDQFEIKTAQVPDVTALVVPEEELTGEDARKNQTVSSFSE